MMLRGSKTLAAAVTAGTAMLLATHDARAVDTLPVRDSADFNLSGSAE